MHVPFQLSYLACIISIAIDQPHVKTPDVGGITRKGLISLDRRCAGWSEDHYRYLLAVDVDSRQRGHAKSGGLAGAGGDVSRQIQTLQQIGIAGVWIGEEGSY